MIAKISALINERLSDLGLEEGFLALLFCRPGAGTMISYTPKKQC